MEALKQIKVYLKFSKEEILVGQMVAEGRAIFFKYAPEFLNKGIEIAPFKLPLSSKIVSADPIPFEGIFGVFNDSLPDGWGRLLLDRKLLAEGIDPNSIGPLERLAIIGEKGNGALIYKPQLEQQDSVPDLVDLDHINEEAHAIFRDENSDLLEELHSMGGASGGARPKVNIQLNPSTNDLLPYSGNLDPNYEPWIVKFPSIQDLPDIANIEYAYYLMAESIGIEMMSSKLLKSKAGNYFFATKRFDRIGNDRLHMSSIAGLLHDDFRRSGLDYGHIMDAAFKLEKNITAFEKVMRLACFNVLAHNRDDHSKNFAFLMNSQGEWKFAPAYDLTYSNSSHGMHSTTIAGEGKNPGYSHLKELADDFRVKNFDVIYKEVENGIRNWEKFAEQAGVSARSIKLIERNLQF